MKTKESISLLAALVLAAPSAFAGNWEAWVESGNRNEVTIVAGFAGDGETQDTQLDLGVTGEFKVISAQALTSGSVCVASPEHGTLRAVPPSGAGVALPKAMTDTCAFRLKVRSGDVAKFSSSLQFKLLECASPDKSVLGCSADLRDVQSSKLIQSKNIEQ